MFLLKYNNLSRANLTLRAKWCDNDKKNNIKDKTIKYKILNKNKVANNIESNK